MNRLKFATFLLIIFSFSIISCKNKQKIAKDHVITVKANEAFKIKLKQNVSTGYIWRQKDSIKTDIVQFLKTEVEKIEENKGQVGASSYLIWHYKAIGKGKQTLNFEYERPWEGKPSKSEKFLIKVE